jgi:MoaA/NifB/PqqE/SkfB family radical SAM enzyme
MSDNVAPLDPADSETFCFLPWIHSYIATDGQAGVCCVSSDPVRGADGVPLNVQKHSLSDIFHSPSMDDARRQILEGKQIKACTACYSAERNGSSLRTYYNALWQEKLPGLRDVIKARQEKAAFDKPLSAHIRFGNLCNLKCQICNSINSSQIERDPILSKWNGPGYPPIDGGRFGADWYVTPEFDAELGDFTSDIVFITLGGGEPSISQPTQQWLQRLVESGQASRIEIHISTNLTNVNSKFFDHVAKFGKVNLYPSVDGFGPLNDYLRYPAKWPTIERAADYLVELMKQGNVEVSVAPVISAYNALSIVHLFEWASARGFGIISFQVRGVDQIDCALIPDEARKLAVQRMRDFIATRNTPADYSTIEDLCRYLESPVDPDYAAACRQKFHEFTREMDQDRGMRFEDYAPEMARYLGYTSR